MVFLKYSKVSNYHNHHHLIIHKIILTNINNNENDKFIVRKKDTGKLYAMKTLSKAKIKRDNKVENILNERAILEKVSHPFII